MNVTAHAIARRPKRIEDIGMPGYMLPVLRESAVWLEIQHGDYLFQHGNPVSQLFFVVSGEIRLIEYAASGAECVLQRAGPGEWIGECSTCMDTYICYAHAVRKSRVIGFPMTLFNRVLHEDVEFANAWAAQLSASLRRIFGRYERRSLKTARERVLHFLVTESHGQAYLDLTHSFAALAAELGLTRESLYRTLAQLEREGTIQREGKRLAVLPGAPGGGQPPAIRPHGTRSPPPG